MTSEILDCGHAPTPSTVGTGYGTDAEGRRSCYACCADQERAAMIADGKAILYVEPLDDARHPDPRYLVTNWPGTLEFRAWGRESRHGGGFGASRLDVWFFGPDGYEWHGVQRGAMNTVVRCRRTKRRVQAVAP